MNMQTTLERPVVRQTEPVAEVAPARVRLPLHRRLRATVSTHRVSLIWMTPCCSWRASSTLWGFGRAPQRVDDEGTYTAQAYAVEHFGELAHYTYWYDHPPLGWLQIAAWTSLTDAFDRYSTRGAGRPRGDAGRSPGVGRPPLGARPADGPRPSRGGRRGAALLAVAAGHRLPPDGLPRQRGHAVDPRRLRARGIAQAPAGLVQRRGGVLRPRHPDEGDQPARCCRRWSGGCGAMPSRPPGATP